MSTPLIINGVTFNYPNQFDKNWGPTLTAWSSAVTSGMLQKAGGSFHLTAEVDFGSAFGMITKSIKSSDANIASTGFLRLANASSGLVWRNAANNADLPLTVNASNQLTFNGISIGATTALNNGHILVGNASNQPADVAMSGDITITNTGVTSLGSGKVVDANVNSSAAIALSKLAPTTAYYWYIANTSGVLTPLGVTASRAVVTDSNGSPTASATTVTELGYVSGVTSAIQTQINTKLAKAGDTMSGVLNMGSNKIVSVTPGANSGEVLTWGQALNGSTLALSGQSLGGNGSVSAPEYAFTNYTNTGVYVSPSPGPISAAAANWNTTNNTVSSAAHGLTNYLEVRLTTSGTLPSGLALATNYYVIVVTANDFALAVSLGAAFSGTKAPFVTQGTGTHTVTATYSNSLSVASSGTEMLHVAPTTLYVGGHTGITQEAQEVIHAEGSHPGGTQYPNTVDVVAMNRGTGGVRYISTTDNLLATYLSCYGSGYSSNWWSGGPTVAGSGELTFESASAGVVIRNLLCSKDTYFWNDGTHGAWSFRFGAAGTEIFNISDLGLITLKSASDPATTTEGALYYNTTAHTYKYYNGSTWKTIATV